MFSLWTNYRQLRLVGLMALGLALGIAALLPEYVFAAQDIPNVSPNFDFPGLKYFTRGGGILIAIMLIALVLIMAVSLFILVYRVVTNSKASKVVPILGAVLSPIVMTIIIGITAFANKWIDFFS